VGEQRRKRLRSGGTWIGGVGEVGGSPARLSVVERLNGKGDSGGRTDQSSSAAFIGW
jgi:hypothetical protein